MSNNTGKKLNIDISLVTLLKIVVVALSCWFLYEIRSVIGIFFIAIVFTAAIEPVVNWFQSKNISRIIAVLLIYFLLFSSIGIIIYFLIPLFARQLNDFSKNAPELFAQFQYFTNGAGDFFNNFKFEKLSNNLNSNFLSTSSSIFNKTANVIVGFISFVAVLSLTFYISINKDAINSFIKFVTPVKYQKPVIHITDKIKSKIGDWMLGQLTLMFVIFLLEFIALSLLGVPYALVLALLGGMLEIFPYIGPTISTIISGTIGLLISPIKGILVLVSYIIIQQLENNVIIPQIMKKAVGLNPVFIILSILIGANVAGVMGVVLAVPVATVINTILMELMNKNHSH